MKRLLKVALAAFLACVCALSLIACNASDEVTGGGDNANSGYEDKDNTGGTTGDPTGGEETPGIDKNLTLPVVSVDFSGGAPSKKDDGYMPCAVSTAGDDASELISNAEAKIKIRGNSTAEGEKKPYRIKFTSKQPMLGLNGGNKFKS